MVDHCFSSPGVQVFPLRVRVSGCVCVCKPEKACKVGCADNGLQASAKLSAMASWSKLALLALLLSTSQAGGRHVTGDTDRGQISCEVASPLELQVFYSNNVQVHIRQVGKPVAGLKVQIIVDGASVAGVSCPATFKLKNLAAGTHLLSLAPVGAPTDFGSRQTSFFVAHEMFWEVGACAF